MNSTVGVLADHGAGGYYLDLYTDPTMPKPTPGYQQFCYRDHSGWSAIDAGYDPHPLGGGSWHQEAKHELLRSMKTVARERQEAAGRVPFFWLSAEDMDETTQWLVDYCWHVVASGDLWRNCDGFDPAIHGYLAVPLYAVVHAGRTRGRALLQEFSTALLENAAPYNDPALHRFMGYVLASEWPYGLTFPALSFWETNTIPLRDPWDESRYQPAGPISTTVRSLRDLWVQMVSAELRFARKYLRAGQFEAPAALDAARTDFTTGLADTVYSNQYFSYDVLYPRATTPRVTHGVWRADDGSVCVLLVNWTDTAARWAGTIDLAGCGLGEPGSGASRRIKVERLDSTGTPTETLEFDADTGDLELATVPAFTVTAVTLTIEPSKRRAIRQSIVDRLIAAQTRAAGRVYSNRADAWQHTLAGGELPAISVYTTSETSQIWNEAPREYRRTAKVSIECLVDQQDNQEGDDQLDDFLQEVEAALFHAEGVLHADVERLIYTGTEVQTSDDGDRLVFVGTVSFDLVYHTLVDELEGVPAPFITAHTQHRFPGDTQDRVVTDVPIPQQ